MAEPEANKKKKNAAAPEPEAAGEAAGTPEAEKAAAQAQTQSPPETPPAESAPADELAQLREENKALADRNLRLMAEFDNYRKRTQRERDAVYPEAVAGTETSKYGARALVRRSLLPAGFTADPVNIEDILLFLVKGEIRA